MLERLNLVSGNRRDRSIRASKFKELLVGEPLRPDGVWDVTIRRWDYIDNTPSAEDIQIGNPHIAGFDPEEKHHIELKICGENLELRVWRDEEMRPDEPVAKATDSSYRSGQVGLSYNDRAGGGNGALRRGVFDSFELCTQSCEAVVQFRRGDSSADNELNIADAVFTLMYLFASGPAPTCLDAADANDDGAVAIADAIAALSHLFAGSSDLPEPFGECGVDPTEDELGCVEYAPCP